MDKSVFSDAHIFRMTDDTGMFQHAKFALPDPRHGYTSDDNARALIMATLLYRDTGEGKYLALVERYLGFLLYAFRDGWFRNFMDYSRSFLEERGSEDCYGRCLWALAIAAEEEALPKGIRDVADYLINETIGGCGSLSYLRAKAYALLGLVHLGDRADTARVIRRLSGDICAAFGRNATPGWKWFESGITYCNAIIPWALIESGYLMGDPDVIDVGLESLDFLIHATFKGDQFCPVGCQGWMERGVRPALYDQQPVEACETLLCLLRACALTGDSAYRDRAHRCYAWYLGDNVADMSLIDPQSGGCCDGITAGGINRNQGAESLVSWIIAHQAWNREEHE